MPPKPQNGAEDAKAEFKAGIVTCSAAEFFDDSRLAFLVQARLALVLDRKNLDDGQIIGMVCENDVACASLVELPWIMLAAGSFVRHPKMREGRIKLQREGWLLTTHRDYGALMAPCTADRVRKHYDEDSFLKLPLVKTRATAKAKASQEEARLPSRRDAEAARLEDAFRQEELARKEAARREEEARREEAERQEALRLEEAARRTEKEETRLRREAKAKGQTPAKAAAEAKAAAKAKGITLDKAAIPAKVAAGVDAASPASVAEGEDMALSPAAQALARGKGAAQAKAGEAAKAKFSPCVRGADFEAAVTAAKASPTKASDARAEADARAAEAAVASPPAAVADPLPATPPGRAAKTKASPAAGSAAAKPKGLAALSLLERAKGPPETLDSHLRTCTGEHWKVVHDLVFMRARASTTSEQICVLRRGAVFCLGALPGVTAQELRSPDGKWVKCCKEAKVWPKVEAREPEFLLKGQAFLTGFVLTGNEEHGDLLRLVPNTKPDGGLLSSKDPLKPADPLLKDVAKPAPEPAEPKAEPVTSEAVAKMHHWLVELDSARVYSSRDEESTEEVTLKEGDVIYVGGASWTRTWAEMSGKKWLLLPLGGQIYRKLQPQFPMGGHKRSSYILVQDSETVLVREYTPPETGVTVRLVSGYGEPWVVEHDQVVVRRGPATTHIPVGIMVKGDVVGISRKQGAWVQLMQDSDVRFRKKGATLGEANTTFLSAVNSVRETKVEEAVVKQRREQGDEPLPIPTDPRGEPPLEAWMLVDHPSLGTLLRRARKRKGGLSNGPVVSKSRLDLYGEVVELCHRRIYEENLETLWEGDRDKLPTLESIEAKLFDSQTSVLHVTNAGKFCGGAIIKEVPVKAIQVEGSGNLNLTGHASADNEERHGRTIVGYIDSCAAEPRTGGGRMIWDSISSMPFVCLTCHSVLLQKTVDFWQARGMRRLDPSSDRDCEEFKKNILVHTMGKVICELSDVEKELPSSKLPLFVWVPSRFSQVSVDPHSDYIFTPDDGDSVYL